MIAGFYYDQKLTTTEKVPSFYLPNKLQFNASISIDNEKCPSKCKSINEEIIILAQFCELVGPMHLIVCPDKPGIDNEAMDMIVLKAMSVDYQACERGDIKMDSTAQTLIMDCSIPFFVHYFTLWDVYARGYVRPCCIIVCCRDKIRAKELFFSKYKEINEILKGWLEKNIYHFYQELHTSKEMVEKILNCSNNEGTPDNILSVEDDFNIKKLNYLQGEYRNLISCIRDHDDSIKVSKKSISHDVLLDVNIALSSGGKELRSIYELMEMTEEEMKKEIQNISKSFGNTIVSESFSLRDSESHQHINSGLFNASPSKRYSKFNVQYFGTAFSLDKSILNFGKSAPLCLCRTILDNLSPISKFQNFEELQEDFIFPNLINIKANQCHFVSIQCNLLGISVVTKLISCLFNQIHLIIYINPQQSYFSLMSFLMLFLPKPHNLNYFVCKRDWPSLEQLNDTPVLFLDKETINVEIPSQLQGYVAIFDHSINEFICCPKYNKGHIIQFFETFKYMEYNHLHLESIINIMLLNYVDMIYQWTTMMSRRDRRWIAEDYLVKLGYSQEDVIISEKLTFYVLQTLVKSKQLPNECNNFLLSSSLFVSSTRRDGK